MSQSVGRVALDKGILAKERRARSMSCEATDALLFVATEMLGPVAITLLVINAHRARRLAIRG